MVWGVQEVISGKSPSGEVAEIGFGVSGKSLSRKSRHCPQVAGEPSLGCFEALAVIAGYATVCGESLCQIVSGSVRQLA